MRKPATRNRSFQSHGAGKGCSDRTSDDKAYRENWDNIDWNRPVDKPDEDNEMLGTARGYLSEASRDFLRAITG